MYLDPGAYETTVLLPEGGSLQYVEVAPPCVEPIEPRGGWKPMAVATTRDVAVTVLQALDLESELPPAGEPIEFRGTDLRLDDGAQAVEAAAGSTAFVPGRAARACCWSPTSRRPASTRCRRSASRPAGQRWLADGCRTCIVCPSTDPTAQWQTILSGQLQQGRHVFAATLGRRHEHRAAAPRAEEGLPRGLRRHRRSGSASRSVPTRR